MHHPRAFVDVCDQDAAIEFIKHTWDGTKPLALVGPIGSGKTTLAGLASKHRNARLVDTSELRNMSHASEYVRMHRNPCYIHLSSGMCSCRDALALIAQKAPLILECTPSEAISEMRDAVRKCVVCKVPAPSSTSIDAWLVDRGVPHDYVIPGDLRATLLDSQVHTAFGSRIDPESYGLLTSMVYCGQNITEASIASDAISDGVLFADFEMAAMVGTCIERMGIGERSVLAREWSTMGIAGARRNALRSHGSRALPTSPLGTTSLFEYVWHAHPKSLDKRGRELVTTHSIPRLKKKASAVDATCSAGATH